MKKTYSALSLSLFLMLLTAPVQAAPSDPPPQTSPASPSQTTATLYTSINTQALESLMQSEGYSVTVDKDGDIIWKIDGLTAALMIDKGGDALLFQISFSDSKANLQHINAWNQSKRYSRSYLADDDRIVLELGLSLEGGVGKGRIIDYLKTCRLSLSSWVQEVALAE